MQNLLFKILIFTVIIFGISCTPRNPDAAEEFIVNGLKVIVKPNRANEIVDVQLYLLGGSLNISEQTQGIEPLIFESALKGSKNYPKEKLNTILDRTAARISTNSGMDYTTMSLHCLNRYFDETWDVFTDIIMNPTFDEHEVELVRDRLLVDIRQRQDDPDSYLRELAVNLFYKEHPYRLDPDGTEASMSKISIEQMKNHLKEYLQTSQLLMVVVGNVNKDDLKQKVEKAFGQIPAGTYKQILPEKVEHNKPMLETVERDLPTNYILGYFSAPAMNDPDYYAMTMAMNILRWRLFEEVRTKRNLSYAPSANYYNDFANRAAIYVTAVDPDTTVKVMLAELKKMQGEGVSAKELKDRISMYITRYYLNNETDAAQASFLARYELSGLGWKASENYVDNLRKVTIDDVKRVANKYFHNIQFVVLGNPKLIDNQVFTSM